VSPSPAAADEAPYGPGLYARWQQLVKGFHSAHMATTGEARLTTSHLVKSTASNRAGPRSKRTGSPPRLVLSRPSGESGQYLPNAWSPPARQDAVDFHGLDAHNDLVHERAEEPLAALWGQMIDPLELL